jgi:LDH2 family malate/lactate/ureidoglycolate dehydrogenase
MGVQNITLAEARAAMIRAVLVRGLGEDDARAIADYYLDAEMRGIKTHGIGKFLTIGASIRGRQAKPSILKDAPAYALVDGRREIGLLAANYCLDLVLEKARQTGMALVALRNASRYSHLAPFSRRLAESNLIGVVLNSAGPPAMAPHGSYTPILGTNPLSIAFPNAHTQDDPLVIDFATSRAVWGEIRQALLEQRPLLQGVFLDARGDAALNPSEAYSVRAAGGAKGYALGLALEILCGAFIGAKMGMQVESEYDLGMLFIALDPFMFRDDLREFAGEIAQLAEDIRAAAPLEAGIAVRLPGDRSNAAYRETQARGALELDIRTWEILREMARGPGAGMPADHLTN